MNLSDTLRALARRWYIVVPGLILAVVAAFGALHVVKPSYERKANELLLPGPGYVPTGDNPYLYLGGLSQAADVVVSAAGADEVVSTYTEKYPGTVVTVTRDPLNSGPAIVIDVTASSDANAATVLTAMVHQVSSTLNDIQARESVPAKDRISVTQISADDRSTIQTKKQKEAAGGAAMAVVVLTLILATFIDGQARRRRRSPSPEDAPIKPLDPFDQLDSLDYLGVDVPASAALSLDSARGRRSANGNSNGNGNKSRSQPVGVEWVESARSRSQ